MRPFRRACAAVALRSAGALASTVCTAHALLAAVPLPLPEQRQPERAPLPEDKPRPDLEFTLPPLPSLIDRPRLSSTLRVSVKRIRFTGNTVFSDAELHPLVADYENRELGNVELEEARLRLTEHYVKNGYINSGAVIPDQDVADGVLTFAIVEGRLTEVQVRGEHRFAPGFISERVALRPTAPLRIGVLQERLQLLAQNPLVDRVNAELSPGERLGEAILRVEVREAPPYEIGYRFANNRSPSIGSYLHELRAAARNLFGRGIGLAASIGKTRGLDEYALAITVPVTASDTTVSFRYDKNRAVVIEQPFAPLDIVSRSDTLELGVAHPLFRSINQDLSVAAYYSNRRTETFLLGEPFSFVAGVPDAHSTINALRLSTDWFYRTEAQVLSARIWIKVGLDVAGATINPNGADAKFVTRFLQFQWVRRVSAAGNQFVLRYDRQFANGKLLPTEKFALGGIESVRGYRENRLVKDQGWFGSLEYRHPVTRWVPAFLSRRREDGVLNLVAFVDKGRAYDDQEIVAGPDRLSSIGVGARWDLTSGIYARFYYAKAQHKIPVRDPDPQDRGLHFVLNLSKAF